MLGDDLLVAPVFGAAGEVAYYVPEGTWTHLLTGAEVTGPRWHTERHGFMSVPVLARPGAVIPVGAVADRPDYDYADGVTLQVYRLPEGAARSVTVPVADPRRQPASFTVSRDRGVIRAEAAGPAGRWQLLLAGVPAVGPVTGGTAAAHEQGTLIQADGGTVEVGLSGGPARPGPGPAAHPGGTAW
jgi:alpha-D-xyloside xylohydrolase